jgi:hypothetical protein
MGKADIDKGPVDLCPAEPVRMDANRGLASEAGLRSESSIHGVSGTTITGSCSTISNIELIDVCGCQLQ